MRDTHTKGRGDFTCVMLNCMAMLIGGHKTLGQLRSTEAEQSTHRANGLSVLKYQLKCPRRIREKVASAAQNICGKCALEYSFASAKQELLPVEGKVAANYCRNSANSIKVLHFELRQPEGGRGSLEN